MLAEHTCIVVSFHQRVPARIQPRLSLCRVIVTVQNAITAADGKTNVNPSYSLPLKIVIVIHKPSSTLLYIYASFNLTPISSIHLRCLGSRMSTEFLVGEKGIDDSSKSENAAVQNFYPVTTYKQGHGSLTDKDTEVSLSRLSPQDS